MKNAYIRYYLLMLYLMNLDVARYAFDTTLSAEARCLSGIGMGIGLVNLWLALRLDALGDQAPELPSQAVRINVGFSLVWNVLLQAAGSGHPIKLAVALALGAVAELATRPRSRPEGARGAPAILALRAAEPRAEAVEARPQLAAA